MASIPPFPPPPPPRSTPSNESEPLVLDGTTLEGGGQLLRLALSLAALTRIPLRIHSIRGSRGGGGGLKAQHLACVEWLGRACGARVDGVVKGSGEVVFVPAREEAAELIPAFKKVKARAEKGEGMREVYEAKLDIRTAGSTGLALQAILPFVLFTRFPSPGVPVRITLSGGTNVSQSPSFEYIKYVLLPTLERIGLPRMEARLVRRGWSQGGSSIGSFVLEIPPRKDTVLPAFNLTPPSLSNGEEYTRPRPRARILHLRAVFIAPAACHAHFTRSLKSCLKSAFPQKLGWPSFTEPHGNLTLELEDSRHSKRMYCLLVATTTYSPPAPSPPSAPSAAEKEGEKIFTLGRDWLYDRKLPQKAVENSHDGPAEEMADRVGCSLATEIESGACVDEHMRDQLVVFQTLAKGRSEIFAGWKEGGAGPRGPGRGGPGEREGEREPSLHARTAEWVAAQILPGVKFDGKGGCEGVGFGADAERQDEVDELSKEMNGLDVR